MRAWVVAAARGADGDRAVRLQAPPQGGALSPLAPSPGAKLESRETPGRSSVPGESAWGTAGSAMCLTRVWAEARTRPRP